MIRFHPKIGALRVLTLGSSLSILMALGACAPLATNPNAAASNTIATTTRAGSATPPRSIMYVGNSFMYYNNSLHGHVGQLARAASEKDRAAHRSVSITISGSGMDWHDVGSYLRPNAVGRYSFVGDNEVRFNHPAGLLMPRS